MQRIIYSCLFIIAFSFVACKKTGNDAPPKAPTQFKIEPNAINANAGVYFPGNTVNFKNTSDSGADVSYSWRFGDGETATGYNASHAYSLPGKYIVSLTEFRGDVAVDSSSSTVQIVALPKLIKRSEAYMTHPYWIAAYGDKIYLAGWQSGIDNFYNTKDRFLTQYDTLWREQWTKTITLSEGGFKKMSLAINGDVLIPMVNKLQRIDANGDVKTIWTTTATDLAIGLATEDKNGNIIMLGSKTYPDPLLTAYVNGVAILLDASGNEKWTYAWPGQGTMQYCSQLVTLNDGYIIAGNKNGPCTLTCDSIHVTRLSLDGKIVWSTIIPWNNGSSTAWDVFTLLDQSNRIQVVSSRSSSYYSFDLDGKFLGSHAYGMNIDVYAAVINKYNSLLVLGDIWSDPRQTRLLEMKADGSRGWVFDVSKSMNDWNFVQYPYDTWGLSMTLNKDNVAIMAGRYRYYVGNGTNDRTAGIFITRANAEGQLY